MKYQIAAMELVRSDEVPYNNIHRMTRAVDSDRTKNQRRIAVNQRP